MPMFRYNEEYDSYDDRPILLLSHFKRIFEKLMYIKRFLTKKKGYYRFHSSIVSSFSEHCECNVNKHGKALILLLAEEFTY